MVFTEPTPGREDDFNRWYAQQHLPDVLALEGFGSAARYAVSAVKSRSGAEPPARYLTVYELDGDPVEALATLSAAIAAGDIEMDSSIDTTRTRSFVFDALDDPRP
jgi:hypothetical protein